VCVCVCVCVCGVCVCVFLTSSFRGPYFPASCMVRVDLKGVGVRGLDSKIERRMFGVLNLKR
jgi:hypothetical protein